MYHRLLRPFKYRLNGTESIFHRLPVFLRQEPIELRDGERSPDTTTDPDDLDVNSVP